MTYRMTNTCWYIFLCKSSISSFRPFMKSSSSQVGSL